MTSNSMSQADFNQMVLQTRLPRKKSDKKRYLSTLPKDALMDLVEYLAEYHPILVDDAANILLEKIQKDDYRLSYYHRLSSGAIKPFTLADDHWDVVKSTDFISVDDYGDGKRVLLNADMSMGKNYAPKHAKIAHRLLAPLRSIVGQQGSRNCVQTDMVTTYDQSKRLLDMASNHEIDVTDEILIIDEVHNFLLADYRLEPLHNVLKLMQLPWKQVVCQSATIGSDDFDGIIEFDSRIRIHKTVAPDLMYYRLHIGDPHHALQQFIYFWLQHPNKSLILHNNTETLLGFKQLLNQVPKDDGSHLVVEIVNADLCRTSGSFAHRLTNDGEFQMDEVDIVLGTTSLVEGISIQDNIDVANVCVIGKEPVQYIKQLCGRFRKASTVHCLHIATNNLDEDVFDIDQWIIEQERLSAMAKETATFMTQQYRAFNSNDHAAFEKCLSMDFKRQGILFDSTSNQYLVSPLSTLFISAEAKHKQFYANRDYANQVLKSLGFTVCKFQSYGKDEEFINLSKATRKQCRENIKEMRRAESTLILNLMFKSTENNHVNIEKVERLLEIYDKELTAFQKRIMAVLKQIDTKKVTYDYLVNAIERLENGQMCDETIIMHANASAAECGIISELEKRYPSGTRILPAEKLQIVADIIESLIRHIMNATHIDKHDAFQFVIRLPRWRKLADKIILNNGIVSCSCNRPVKILRDFLPEFIIQQVQQMNLKYYVLVIV